MGVVGPWSKTPIYIWPFHPSLTMHHIRLVTVVLGKWGK